MISLIYELPDGRIIKRVPGLPFIAMSGEKFIRVDQVIDDPTQYRKCRQCGRYAVLDTRG